MLLVIFYYVVLFLLISCLSLSVLPDSFCDLQRRSQEQNDVIENQESITFGISVPYSVSPIYEQAMRKINSLEMYAMFVKECLGGLKIGNRSYNIDIVALDDGGEVARVKNNTINLIKKYGANILFTSLGPSLEVASLSVAEEMKTITVGGTDLDVACRGRHYCYSVLTPASQMMKSTINALAVQGAQTIQIFYVDSAVEYVEACGGIEAVVASLSHKFNLSVTNTFIIPGNNETEGPSENVLAASYFASIVSSFSEPQPADVLFGCIANCDDFVPFAKANQFNAKAMIFPKCIDDGKAQRLGNDGNYILSPTQWNEKMNYKCSITGWTASQFSYLYKKLYGNDAMMLAANTFAAALSVGSAIEAVGTLNSDDIAYEMNRLDITTFFGRIRFNTFNMNSADMALLQLNAQSKVNIVSPNSVATAPLIYPMPTWEQRACVEEFGANACECGGCRQCQDADYSFALTPCDAISASQIVVYYKINSSTCVGGVALPRSVSVDCPYIPQESSLGRFIFIFSIFGASFGAFYTLWIGVHFSNKIVAHCQPRFSVLFCIFVAGASLSTLLYIGPITSTRCLKKMWILHLSVTGFFGSLFVKVYRIRQLMYSREAKIHNDHLSNKNMLLLLILFLLISVFLLVGIQLSSSHYAEIQYRNIPNVGSIPYPLCVSNSTFVKILTFYEALLLAFGCVLSHQIRNVDTFFKSVRKVPSYFSETNETMVAIYSCGLVIGISFLGSTFQDVSAHKLSLLHTFGISSSCIIALNSVFLPKLAKVYGWNVRLSPKLKKLHEGLRYKRSSIDIHAENCYHNRLSEAEHLNRTPKHLVKKPSDRDLLEEIKSSSKYELDCDIEILLKTIEELQTKNVSLKSRIKRCMHCQSNERVCSSSCMTG